jgi:hypothetical protein
MTYWCEQAETALARVTGEAGTKETIDAIS